MKLFSRVFLGCYLCFYYHLNGILSKLVIRLMKLVKLEYTCIFMVSTERESSLPQSKYCGRIIARNDASGLDLLKNLQHSKLTDYEIHERNTLINTQ